MILDTETILPDDYPVYGGYVYVCDGKLFENPHFHPNMTVGFLKRMESFTEVRRCDIVGRIEQREKEG